MSLETSRGVKHFAPPPVIGDDFQSVVKDLAGMSGPEVDDLGLVMRANLFTDCEAVAAMLINAASCMSQALNKLANDAKEEQPAELFKSAGRMLDKANCEFRIRCKHRADVLRSQTPPKFSSAHKTRILPLKPGAKYSLTSDPRNDGTIEIAIDETKTKLAPGESFQFMGGPAIEVRSDEHQLLRFARVGGQVYVGDMRDVVTLPLLIKFKHADKPVEPVEPSLPLPLMMPEPKRSWLPSFFKNK